MAQSETLGITPGRPNFGKQCARNAVTGSTFCVMHGGKADTRTSDLVRQRQDRGRVQCVRTKSSGEQCKNSAIPGGSVCRKHGGNAPQVQKAARERFNDLIDPMINIASHMVEEARSGRMTHADQLRLVTFIADRAGFGTKAEVQVEVKPWEQTMRGILRTAPPELRQDLPELEAVGLGDDAAAIEQEFADSPPVTPRVVGSRNPRGACGNDEVNLVRPP